MQNLEKTKWVKPSEQGQALYEGEEVVSENPIIAIINFFFDFLQSIALGGAFFVVFYLFIIQPHQVKGSSMYPTFKDKEYILTDKITYKFSTPQRGDVIILQSPKNPDIDYIKRVIGLPGETIKVNEGKVYLNGQLFQETYLSVTTPIFPGGFLQDNQEVTVPENNYFVMGDNRPGSSDSREFGFVPYEHIIGKVIFRYFPVDRLGAIKKPSYSR
jgi:signal peptidase I